MHTSGTLHLASCALPDSQYAYTNRRGTGNHLVQEPNTKSHVDLHLLFFQLTGHPVLHDDVCRILRPNRSCGISIAAGSGGENKECSQPRAYSLPMTPSTGPACTTCAAPGSPSRNC